MKFLLYSRRGIFSYFVKQGHANPPVGEDHKGLIDLKEYKIAYIEDQNDFVICLAPSLHGGRSYYFRAPSLPAAEEFIAAINLNIQYAKGMDNIDYA